MPVPNSVQVRSVACCTSECMDLTQEPSTPETPDLPTPEASSPTECNTNITIENLVRLIVTVVKESGILDGNGTGNKPEDILKRKRLQVKFMTVAVFSNLWTFQPLKWNVDFFNFLFLRSKNKQRKKLLYREIHFFWEKFERNKCLNYCTYLCNLTTIATSTVFLYLVVFFSSLACTIVTTDCS